MITTAELHRAAASEGLRFDQVEKDYLILWVLAALARSPELMRRWVFKGGTCLRHCYYPRCRFSDDIDFTCEPETDNQASSTAVLESTARIVREETGLTLSVKDPLWSEGQEQLEIGIEYSRGGTRRHGLPAVKVHLTFDEPVLRPTQTRAVRPPYSDLEPFHIACYSKAEIVAEKLRSLLQQQDKWPRPRDLHDLWFVLCHRREPLGGPDLRDLFERKCKVRGIEPASHRLFSDHLKEWNRQAWEIQLSPTMKDPPDYERVWRDWKSIGATIL